jgi:hypothetical protein
VLLEHQPTVLEQVHRILHTLLILFVELQIELPRLGFALGELPELIGERNADLDKFEVVAVGFDHLVLEVLKI